ncbi:MAG TPA: hypothetical protein VFV67_31040 [Actinophytocola sp.]|uniref:hypothetical protein n=1 Tax=Actinophytocola sp. TaxID=1872138 RepID=UPI002DB6074C|nr:hypothetical protein [Actinophytocola sp.]HEU5475103.1 hypothetical protein [Actinophytocola sp.]
MGPRTITVDERTHARLAELAAENSTTVAGYLARVAGTGRTPAEWAQIAARTEEYLRTEFGFVATPEELAEFEAKQAAVETGRNRPVRRTSA